MMRRLVGLTLALAMASGVASVSLLASSTPVMAECLYGSNQTSTHSITNIYGFKVTSKVIYRIFSCNGVPADLYVVSMTITDAITDSNVNSNGQDLKVMGFWSNEPVVPDAPPDHRWWTSSPESVSCNPFSGGTCFTKTEAVGKSGDYSTGVVAIYTGGFFGYTESIIYDHFLGSAMRVYPV